MFTIDASVWVNAVSPEETKHESSKAFLDFVFTNNLPIVVPHLVRVEISAAFARAGKSAAKLRELTDLLSAAGLVQLISLDDALSKKAANVATINRLRGADAVYVAVALEYDCHLVSLDDEHLTKIGTVLEAQTPLQALETLTRKQS